VTAMLILARKLPPWVSVAASALVGAGLLWWLVGETLLRNRKKLDGLWFAKAVVLTGCCAATVGFFLRLFGGASNPFYGYSAFEHAPALGWVTMGVFVTPAVLVFLTSPTRTGLLLCLFQAELGVLGELIWAPWIRTNLKSLGPGSYLLMAGLALVILGALFEFKLLGDEMPGPEG